LELSEEEINLRERYMDHREGEKGLRGEIKKGKIKFGKGEMVPK
jgi:hypothetical protein